MNPPRHNLEAKFRIHDIIALQQQAEAIGFEYVATLVQHDTFFVVSNGKLKLRKENNRAQLIYYRRYHDQGLEVSSYQIASVQEPAKLRGLLSTALGILAEVQKQRVLLRRRQLRLHLDQVIGHGTFGELEAVVDPEAVPADYRAEISDVLAALKIHPRQLLHVSYFELGR
jgi:adenylate cyclase class 2